MQYRGIDITLDGEHFFNAKVEGEVPRAATYRELTEKIDNLLAIQEKHERKRWAVPVLMSNGKPAKVTGIHATRGIFNGLPDVDDRGKALFADRYNIFPDTPRMAELLRKREELRRAYAEFNIEVQKYALTQPSAYGHGKVNPAYVEETMSALEKEVAEKAPRDALLPGEKA
jgi:hypothetical protein